MIEKIVRPLPKVVSEEKKMLRTTFRREYIVDIETTGLDCDKDIIVCMGIADLYRLQATIYFLKDARRWGDFHRFCRNTVLTLLNRGKVWAYNSEFEESFLQLEGISDLLCLTSGATWRMKLNDAYLDAKIDLKLDIKVDDKIGGSDIPTLYMKNYNILGDENAKWLIINHNYYDLVREYIIRIYTSHLASALHQVLRKNYIVPKTLLQVIDELI